MKNIVKTILKTMIVQFLTICILIWAVSFAVSWPSWIPDWESAWWKFINFINSLSWSCPNWEAITWFDSNLNKKCSPFEMPLLCWIDQYESTPWVCSFVSIWEYSPDLDNSKYLCTNKPANSSYTSDGNGINDCSFSCDSWYILDWSSCIESVDWNDQVNYFTIWDIITYNSSAVWIIENNNVEEWGNNVFYCDNLILWWKSDWYMPSKDELQILYNNRSIIWDFESDKYRSSTDDGSRYWAIDFSNWIWDTYIDAYMCNVHCIRKN